MIFRKKTNKYKPLYKQLLSLKESLQNQQKLLKLKKKKWKKFKQNYFKKVKQYQKFKIKDQNQYLIFRFPFKGFSYNNSYKNTLQEIKKLKFFNGNISKKFIKKSIKMFINHKNIKINLLFLEIFEKRLDVILYRSKFSPTLKNARQLIFHGIVSVNNKTIKIKSFKLKSGDLIKINLNYWHLISINIQKSQIWPLPPKYLTINYKILQILVGTLKKTSLSTVFFYNINLEKVLTSYYKY